MPAERVGLLLLQGQRGLARQPRAPRGAIRRRSRARSACPLPDGAAVRLRSDRPFVDDDGGAAERRDPGRGDVAFERRHIRCRHCRSRAACSRQASGVSAMAATSLPHRQRAPRFTSRSGGCLRAGFRRRGCRLCRFDGSSGSAPPASRALPASRPQLLGRRRRYHGGFRNCGGADIRPAASRRPADRRAAGPGRHRVVVQPGKHRLGRRPSRRKVGKFLMRGAQQSGGAKPEHQDRHRKDDRGEQETKTGEHGREFRLALSLQGY